MAKKNGKGIMENPPQTLATRSAARLGVSIGARGRGRGTNARSGPATRGGHGGGPATRGGHGGGPNSHRSVPIPPGSKGKQAAQSTAEGGPSEVLPSTPRGGLAGRLNGQGTPPTPGGGISQVGGTSGNGGGSSTSRTSSMNTVSGSASRTRMPSQFPPLTQPILPQQLAGGVPPPPPMVVQPQFEDDEDEDQVEYPPNDLPVQHEDAVIVQNPIGADYQILLDNLMNLPGREQLPRLSEHPIPNVRTTW